MVSRVIAMCEPTLLTRSAGLRPTPTSRFTIPTGSFLVAGELLPSLSFRSTAFSCEDRKRRPEDVLGHHHGHERCWILFSWRKSSASDLHQLSPNSAPNKCSLRSSTRILLRHNWFFYVRACFGGIAFAPAVCFPFGRCSTTCDHCGGVLLRALGIAFARLWPPR